MCGKAAHVIAEDSSALPLISSKFATRLSVPLRAAVQVTMRPGSKAEIEQFFEPAFLCVIPMP